MGLIKALVLSVIAGVAGAAVWAAVVYFFHFELGLIAWGIGALVGAAAGFGAGHQAGGASGALAVVVAILAILLGKAAVVGVDLAQFVQQNPPRTVTDENLVSYFADEIVNERVSAGETIEWPEGVEPEAAWVAADYPADVWAEAQAEWDAMTDEDRTAHRERIEGMLAYSNEDMARMFQGAFTSSFSMFDLLWIGLAVLTAFRLGASPMVEVAAGSLMPHANEGESDGADQRDA